MATDRNKKSLRTFQCRDYLWEYFEQMSGELDCSVDYLINEAMRQYARARVQAAKSGASKRPPSGASGRSSSSASIPSIRTAGSGSHPGFAAGSGSMPPPPPPSPSSPVSSSSGAFAAPPTPQAPAPPEPPPTPQPPPPSQPPLASPPDVTPRPSAPPPLPGQQRPLAPPGAPGLQRPSLFLVFNGQKIPIDKDEFVIGRGAKHADLPIKDGNISRRHAAVVFQDGQFFMKDLGSTNGIEYAGQRVEARRIDEGDVFHLCDYELRFTYR
ncbi:MAG: FHA domain-containing protein [Myxococcota bacterium]